jgi:hypothetical protein
MRGFSSQCEPDTIGSAVKRIIMQPWTVFVRHWNWKAAVLSAGTRGLLFCIAVIPGGMGDLRGVSIEIVFRILLGGCWGSLMQAFRRARPAWVAGSLVAVILPAGAHTVEFAALKAGGATQIKSGMTVSVILSVVSLGVNFSLMRRGLMLTGEGAPSLACDFRRLPAALRDCALSALEGLRRATRRFS